MDNALIDRHHLLNMDQTTEQPIPVQPIELDYATADNAAMDIIRKPLLVTAAASGMLTILDWGMSAILSRGFPAPVADNYWNLLLTMVLNAGPVCYVLGAILGWNGRRRATTWLLAGAGVEAAMQILIFGYEVYALGGRSMVIASTLSSLGSALFPLLVLWLLIRPETRRALFPR